MVRRRIPLDAEHARDPSRVRALLEEALAHYRDRHPRASPKMVWQGPNRAELSAHVRGIRLTGHVTLLPDAVEVEVEVPFLLRPFQGLAISRVEHEVERWLRGDRPR
ncbi:MAG: polyhydroxyalkanoic acid system family protein [Polyangia bacterium]